MLQQRPTEKSRAHFQKALQVLEAKFQCEKAELERVYLLERTRLTNAMSAAPKG